ncbi:uncharacterized protein METZ01_LOCUS280780, partial [marine metagenome]
VVESIFVAVAAFLDQSLYIAAMRRSKGSGSIRKRENAWEVRYLGPPGLQGKKKHIYETCHGSRRDAEQLLGQPL